MTAITAGCVIAEGPEARLTTEPVLPGLASIESYPKTVGNPKGSRNPIHYVQGNSKVEGYACDSASPSKSLIWKTAIVPESAGDEPITFWWAAGTGKLEVLEGRFHLYLNNKQVLSFNPSFSSRRWSSPRGELVFDVKDHGRAGLDSYGLMRLTVPPRFVTPGEPAVLKVVAGTLKSPQWYGVFPAANAFSRPNAEVDPWQLEDCFEKVRGSMGQENTNHGGNPGRVVVLGFDGLDYDLVNQMSETGKLPNLRFLMQHGASGQLASTFFPNSPPAWAAFMTGTEPGKSGVFGFESVVSKRRVSSKDIKTPVIWEILSENDIAVAALEFPFTYPADVFSIKGLMISGWLTPKGAVFGNPAETTDFLREIGLNPSYTRSESTVQEAFRQLKLTTELTLDILERTDIPLVMMYCLWTDNFGHRFRPGVQVVQEAYRMADQAVGDIVGSLGKDDLLFIVSDHGGGIYNKFFFVDRWLEAKGYLARDKRGKIDQSASKAWTLYAMSDVAGIQVNEKIKASPTELSELREQLKNDLLNIENRGEPVVETVLYSEEVFQGPFAEYAPDVMFRARPEYSMDKTHRRSPETFLGGRGWDHKPNGTLVAYGKDVQPGPVDGARIVDMTPTILYKMGFTVPSYMDGKVLTQMFTDDYVSQHEVTIEEAVAPLQDRGAAEPALNAVQERALTEQLRALGYVK